MSDTISMDEAVYSGAEVLYQLIQQRRLLLAAFAKTTAMEPPHSENPGEHRQGQNHDERIQNQEKQCCVLDCHAHFHRAPVRTALRTGSQQKAVVNMNE